MSSNAYLPTDTLTPSEIATATPSMRNHPIPAGVHVERQPVGHTNSANESGGYVSPADIARR
jgi:hypothetical protein